MKISIAALLGTSLLTAGTVFASQNGRFIGAASPLPPISESGLTRRQTPPELTSGNWAGAILGSPPSGTNFTTVLGTFPYPM